MVCQNELAWGEAPRRHGKIESKGSEKKDVQFPRPEKEHGVKPKTISPGAHYPSMMPLTINSPLKLTVLALKASFKFFIRMSSSGFLLG
jgi:hypothetical protein